MQSLGILRRLACGASLVLAALAAGCMSIADPVTLAERKSAQPIPMKDVLVVLDYRLDVGVTGRAGSVHLDRYYNPLGEIMAEAVRAAGGTPTVVHVRNADQIPTATNQYSHVWTQRITSLTGYTGGGFWADQRTWKVDIAHRQVPGAALSPAYEMHYVSDGVVCFGLSQYANKEDCRNKLREQVNRQLQQYRTGS